MAEPLPALLPDSEHGKQPQNIFIQSQEVRFGDSSGLHCGDMVPFSCRSVASPTLREFRPEVGDGDGGWEGSGSEVRALQTRQVVRKPLSGP